MRRLNYAVASRRTVQEWRTGGTVSYVSFQVIKGEALRQFAFVDAGRLETEL